MPTLPLEVSIFTGSAVVLPAPMPIPFPTFVAVIFFVVPVAASVVSLTSTIGNMSVAAGAADNSVNAVIFFVLISMSPIRLPRIFPCHRTQYPRQP